MNYAQFELLKDIDLKSVSRWSAASCYAAKPKIAPSMYSASGEQVAVPETAGYVDGAAAILGKFQTSKPICMPASQVEGFSEHEHFVVKMEKCIDGSSAPSCVTKNKN